MFYGLDSEKIHNYNYLFFLENRILFYTKVFALKKAIQSDFYIEKTMLQKSPIISEKCRIVVSDHFTYILLFICRRITHKYGSITSLIVDQQKYSHFRSILVDK